MGMNVSDISKCIQHEFLLARHRAGRDPDLFPFREKAGERYIQRPAQLNHVIFQIAEDRHLFRICAERFDSFSIRLRLHTDDRVILKHALKPSPHDAAGWGIVEVGTRYVRGLLRLRTRHFSDLLRQRSI